MAWRDKCSHCGDIDHECYRVKCCFCLKEGWSNEFEFMGYENGSEMWDCGQCASIYFSALALGMHWLFNRESSVKGEAKP